MASSRDILKKAGAGGLESALQTIMPQLMERLDSIQVDVRRVDMKVDQLRQDMNDKFEQTRDVINELGHRMAKVEGRLEEVIRGMERQDERMHRQSDKMDQWIERLVRLEMTRGTRRGKKAS